MPIITVKFQNQEPNITLSQDYQILDFYRDYNAGIDEVLIVGDDGNFLWTAKSNVLVQSITN